MKQEKRNDNLKTTIQCQTLVDICDCVYNEVMKTERKKIKFSSTTELKLFLNAGGRSKAKTDFTKILKKASTNLDKK